MRRILCCLLLTPALGQGDRNRRVVAEILAGHAAALGDAGAVRTLTATGRAQTGAKAMEPAKAVWARGRFRLELGKDRRMLFADTGAFFLGRSGVIARYRPGLRTGQAHYLWLDALAHPFPLEPFLRDEELAKTLTLRRDRSAQQILLTPPDRHGITRAFYLDPKTQLLASLRYIDEERIEIVKVDYEQYQRVGGVELPRKIIARCLPLNERPDKKDPVRSRFDFRILFDKYSVNAAVGGSFVPRTRAKTTGERFERRVLATGRSPRDVAAADLDGDGRVDIAVACWGGLYVHFGGSESKPVFVPLGEGTHAGCAIEDLDLDGYPEVLTTSYTKPSNALYAVSFRAGRRPAIERFQIRSHFVTRILAHDFDRDGLGDVLMTSRSTREVEVKYGNGLGTFRLTSLYRELDPAGKRGSVPWGVAVGDLEANGIWNVLVADTTALRVFNVTSIASFQWHKEGDLKGGPSPVDVVLVDLDGNGFDDVVVTNVNPRGDDPEELVVFQNKEVAGKRALELSQRIEAGDAVWCLGTGDFDGDGAPDIAAASSGTGEIRIFLNDGKGSLDEKGEIYESGWGVRRFAVADLNGDRRDDIVASNALQDTLAILINKGDFKAKKRKMPARARLAKGPTCADFVLRGLSDTYRFMGEWRFPKKIRDPSGLAYLGGNEAYAQLCIVSDKEEALFRVTVDKLGHRVLVGPPIKLRPKPEKSLDLEGIVFDRRQGRFLVASEKNAAVLEVSTLGHVLGRAPTGIDAGDGDGLEGIALYRRKDGSPRLYLFKERLGKTGIQPPVVVCDLDYDPFVLGNKTKIKLPYPVLDQTGATVAGNRLLVVHRLARQIVEIQITDEGLGTEVKRASYMELIGLLNLETRFGMAEGIVTDAQGDLYLLMDNNGKEYGAKGVNRGKGGRLLWFHNRDPAAAKPVPQVVDVRHILIGFKGARGAASDRSQADAEKLARDLLARARKGEDFGKLMSEYSDAAGQSVSPRYKIRRTLGKLRPGEIRSNKLPAAFERTAFALDVGEIALCLYDEKEAPHGFHVIKRTK